MQNAHARLELAQVAEGIRIFVNNIAKEFVKARASQALLAVDSLKSSV